MAKKKKPLKNDRNMNDKLKIHMKNKSLPFGVYQKPLQINMKRINKPTKTQTKDMTESSWKVK